MDSHVEFDGYAKASDCLSVKDGRNARTVVVAEVVASPCHVVLCVGSGIDVVLRVVVASSGIDAVGHAVPLCRVACGLQASWQVAADGQGHCRVASDDVAHASSEPDGIGCHHAFVFGEVGEHDAVVFALAFGEVECAEIDPSAPAHLLVDAKVCCHSAVLDGIECVGDAVGQGLVGDIDGVVVLLQHFGNPDDVACCLTVLCCLCHLEGAFAEGVLAVLVAFLCMGEADAAVLPMVLGDALFVAAAVVDDVVVDDDFAFLPVAFSGSEHDGSGIFEHGYEVGHDEGLGEQVFGGAEEPWPLPYPFLLLVAEVFAVALADAEVSALQAFLDGVGRAEGRHPRVALVEFPLIDARGVGLVGQSRGNELLDGRSGGADAQSVGIEGRGQQAFHLGIEVGDDGGRKRLRYEVVAQHDCHRFLQGVGL